MTELHPMDSEGTSLPSEDVSLFRIGSTIVRHRWRILRWMVLGAVVAVIPVLMSPPTFTASTSFIPQEATAPDRSGLASLAGQFGVSLGNPSAAHSPEFYVSLVESRTVLGPIVQDTFVLGVQRVELPTLFEVEADSEARRNELAMDALRESIAASLDARTGVITVRVTTPWPTISHDVAQQLVEGLNSFNLRTLRTQAAAERQFTEARLNEARSSLREAEDRLLSFMKQNREFGNSPELVFQQQRLQRDVTLQQGITLSLAQSFEEARIREVRNTPVISIIEAPNLPLVPNGRGRLTRLIAGMLAGAFIAVLLALTIETVRRRRAERDPEAEAFMEVLSDAKADVRRFVPPRRARRPAGG